MNLTQSTLARMAASAVLGIATSAAVGLGKGGTLAVMLGWVVAAGTFCIWTWLVIGRMDAAATKAHATREDPGRAIGDTVLLVASLAGIAGVGALIAASAGQKGGADVEAVVGVLSVAASWVLVHTLFTLRYARLYFGEGARGMDFNTDDEPVYADFAYVGFTIGMTYQVSDTAFSTRVLRHTALRHALISFLLGAVILACTINLVSQLASGGS